MSEQSGLNGSSGSVESFEAGEYVVVLDDGPTCVTVPQAKVRAEPAAIAAKRATRVIILPGNHGSGQDASEKGWYAWLRDELNAGWTTSDGFEVIDEIILRDMPDPIDGRRSIWVPFVESLGIDEHTVLVGHSTGAACAMRLCEVHRVFGLLLVSAYHTDLGLADETFSGYFPPSGGPWAWERIRQNTKDNIVIINSSHCREDVPLGEGRQVSAWLAARFVPTDIYSNWPNPAIVSAAQRVIGVPPVRSVRVFAFTAGLSKSVWNEGAWQLSLPADVESRGASVTILPVNVPSGRFDSIAGIARALVEVQFSEEQLGSSASSGGAGKHVVADEVTPPAIMLLGHGLGAWIAVEVLIALQARRASRLPELLVVSGIRPPHLSAARHDADEVTPSIATLAPSSAFWSAFARRYGVHPDLAASEDLRAMFEAPMRDELGLLERHIPSAGAGEVSTLSCDVLACASEGDPRLRAGQLAAWKPYAGRTFEEARLPPSPAQPPWATSHRYILDGSPQLRRAVEASCARLAVDT
jgi:surfactin synthase thioesterase subunit